MAIISNFPGGGGGKAKGTALPQDVLKGKTFSNDNDTGLTGTIPSKAAATYTPSTATQTIPAGQYLSGTQTISAVAGLSAANVKNAAVVGGVTGTYKGTGTATAAQVLSGATFSTASLASATGTVPSKSSQTYTPKTTNQTIASGQYLSGTQTIKGDANLVASNIASGKSIFGVAGTLIAGKKSKTGSINVTTNSNSDGSISVTGLGFRPSSVIWILNYSHTYASKPMLASISSNSITGTQFRIYCGNKHVAGEGWWDEFPQSPSFSSTGFTDSFSFSFLPDARYIGNVKNTTMTVYYLAIE